MRRRTRAGMRTLAVCVLLLLFCMSEAGADLRLSETGKAFIKGNEGCVLTAYYDVNGYAIGYGHHGAEVTYGMVITRAQADAFFEEDIERFEQAVNRLAARNGITLLQSQFDALTDFAYNEGAAVFDIYDTTIEQYLRDGWQKHPLEDWIYAFCRFDTRHPGLQARHRRQAEFFWRDAADPCAAGHESVAMRPVPATDDKDGQIGGTVCGRCGKTLSGPVAVSRNAVLRVPAAMNTIGEEAFCGIAAQQVVIPDGVTEIGARAFADCRALRIVVLPDSVETVAPDAFAGCGALVIFDGSGTDAYSVRLPD